MATIQDVARHAGVSPMTVSNVINRHPHVKDSTRDRVLLAMEELGYRVNIAARNLRAGRTGKIGLAVPEIDRPYFGQLAARLIAIGERRGYRVVVEQTGLSRENELAAIADSRLRIYDGLILAAASMHREDEESLRASHPIVIVGEQEFHRNTDHVSMANDRGAQIATEHLIDRGCRRIALVTGSLAEDSGIARARHRGFITALDAHGVPYDESLVIEIPLTMENAYRHVTRMIERSVRPDGIFCITDTVAFGAMRAIVDQGLSIPRDIKVAGFDNVDESRFSIPRLTTIDPDHDKLASQAMELLLARIADPDSDTPPRGVVCETTLVVRESTAGA